jgi:hypothetical protein
MLRPLPIWIVNISHYLPFQDYVTEYEKKLKTLNDICQMTHAMYKKTLVSNTAN